MDRIESRGGSDVREENGAGGARDRGAGAERGGGRQRRPSGRVTSALIGRGQASRSFEAHQRKGNDVVVNQNTILPAGYSGWHSHPGTTVVAVQSGQVTLFSEPLAGGTCRVHTYAAGQVFLEHPDNEYNAVNTGSETTVVAVTFFNVPHLGSARIEQDDPGNC